MTKFLSSEQELLIFIQGKGGDVVWVRYLPEKIDLEVMKREKQQHLIGFTKVPLNNRIWELKDTKYQICDYVINKEKVPQIFNIDTDEKTLIVSNLSSKGIEQKTTMFNPGSVKINSVCCYRYLGIVKEGVLSEYLIFAEENQGKNFVQLSIPRHICDITEQKI
jgi:hypothetical protein